MAWDSRDLRWQLKHWLRLSPALQEKRWSARSTVADRFNAEQQQRHRQLQARYHLDDWPRLCDDIEHRENLYLLDLFDRHLPALAPHCRGLDIGSRNFSHLPALSAFMPGPWDGIELDAHVRYWNGYTRRAYGEWMAKQRAGSRYIAGNLLDHQGTYDLIVWTLPYVVEGPLQAWGLPQRFFQPLVLLQHACSLLQPGGVMLVVNQGKEEAEVQQQLFAQAGLTAQSLGALASVFSPFRHQRFGWLLGNHPTTQETPRLPPA